MKAAVDGTNLVDMFKGKQKVPFESVCSDHHNSQRLLSFFPPVLRHDFSLVLVKISKKEIARLLQDGKEEKARIKVEQVCVRDVYMCCNLFVCLVCSGFAAAGLFSCVAPLLQQRRPSMEGGAPEFFVLFPFVMSTAFVSFARAKLFA